MMSEENVYSELIKVWRNEISKNSLTSLPSDFFIRFQGHLTRLRKKAKNNMEVRINYRLLFLFNDILKIRTHKLLTSAQDTTLDPKNLQITREERQCFDELKENITKLQNYEEIETKKIRAEFIEQNNENKDLSEEFKPTRSDYNLDSIDVAKGKGQIEKSSEPSEDLTLVRIIKPIEESFVGADGLQYGPFKVGDVIFLPFPNEKTLISRGFAIEIDYTSSELTKNQL